MAQEEDGYRGALVAEGGFYDPSEEDGYEEHDPSGTSTLQTPPYTGSTYTNATDPVLAFRGRGHTPAPRIPMEDKGTAFRRPG